MRLFFECPLLRLALIGALAASFGLAACGRKGLLDPPPGASLDGAPPAASPSLLNPIAVTPIGGSTASNHPGVDRYGQPLAPKGPDKKIPLDVLLN